MRFLADECVHGAIVAALREAGHEVTTLAPSETGVTDDVLLMRAVRLGAVLFTAGKDFGKLAVAGGAAPMGIVLFRRLIADPAGAAGRLLGLIEQHGGALHRLYAVITPVDVRLRPLAAPGAPAS